VFYGHFVFLGGEAAVSLGTRYGVPSVIALGESDITRYETWLGLDFVRATVAKASGLIVVSKAIRNYCQEVLGVPPAKILLAPNGVDCTFFRPYSREASRRALGLSTNRPIVTFVGQFVERKGPNRALEAMSLAKSQPLGAFLGAGPQKPKGMNVVYAGPVPHGDVPRFLSASDAFILPTLAEGSCNAILEALACGLPVVSSSIPAIRDDFGGVPPMFLADARDTAALAAQLDRVLGLPDEATQLLRSKARKLAETRSLTARALTILHWLEQITVRPEPG
jgi:glycosyltransferase involved in cell wall biosynthesis